VKPRTSEWARKGREKWAGPREAQGALHTLKMGIARPSLDPAGLSACSVPFNYEVNVPNYADLAGTFTVG